MNLRPWTRPARYLLAAVFLWACAHKILDPQAFAVDVFRYHLLPATWVNPVAWSLPWVECVLALALIGGSPGWRKAAALLALLLLLAFTAGMGLNMIRGNTVACGCFRSGGGAEMLPAWNLVRNLALAGLAGLVWRHEPHEPAG